MNNPMNNEQSLTYAQDLLQPWTLSSETLEINRLDVVLAAENLANAVQALRTAQWGYLSAITGIDRPAPQPEGEAPAAEDQIEIIYHFCWGASVASLHVFVPYSNPVVPTVCKIIPSAVLYEQELIEMYGVEISDTPTRAHLLLPDDWPEGVYPLRKSFHGLNSQGGKA